MANWQYAWLTDQPYTTIGFSHPQPGLAAELAGVLGVGVYAQQSTEWSISLDRSRVNLGYVSGLLGDRGWEMFAVETRLQPNAMTPAQVQTNWYFKRPGQDRPAGAAMSTSSSQSAPAMSASPSMSAAPSMPAAPSMSAGPQPHTYDTQLSGSAPVAPMVDAAPPMPYSAPDAAPAMPSFTADATPSMASAPEMAPQIAPEAPPAMPTAPMAPAGPEPTSMSGAMPPPPGPGGYTPGGG